MADEAGRRRAPDASSDPDTRWGVAAISRSRTGVIAVAVAATLLAGLGIALWLLLRGDDGATTEALQTPASAASLGRLNAFASSVDHPIYWIGPAPDFTYELSRTKDGRVYIRYLPAGVEVGNRKPKYLTVGTYPQRNAFATLRATATKQGKGAIHVHGGGLAFQYKNRPTSVYLAYPGSDYQIEVFDPSPTRALRLVTSGQVKPVGAPPRTRAGAEAVTVAQLRELATTLGHPIYWAGSDRGSTYELTRTKDGSVYIRYLPPGVSLGTAKPAYLTIGTYPLKDALEVLNRAASKNHIRTIQLADGGVAFIDENHATSVYVAYPGADVQVEVYDPAPGRARRLVTSGRITPVG